MIDLDALERLFTEAQLQGLVAYSYEGDRDGTHRHSLCLEGDTGYDCAGCVGEVYSKTSEAHVHVRAEALAEIVRAAPGLIRVARAAKQLVAAETLDDNTWSDEETRALISLAQALREMDGEGT